MTTDVFCPICKVNLRTGSYDGYVCSIECSIKKNLARSAGVALGLPFIPVGGSIEPYRNPAPPTEFDFAVVVFRTDHRVLKHVKTKWEVRLDANGNPEDLDAWHRAMEACYELGKTGHAPEAEWYREAQELSERVGKRWDDTPIPTLVEALARKDGHWPLGFPTTTIPAGATIRIATQPQIPFRGRRLVLGAEEIASRLLVQDIRVGNTSYLCGCSAIPGAVFSDRAFPMWLKLPAAQVSQIVTLLLENVSGVNVSVTAMLQGDVIEPDYRPMNLNAIYGKHAQVIVPGAYQPKSGEKILYEDTDSVIVESKEHR